MQDLLNTPAANWLERGLDASTLRQRVLANNLANVETPNFKRSEVSFEEELKKAQAQKANLALVRTHPRHRPNFSLLKEVRPRIYMDSASTMRNDGNNVDVDSENAKLAINSLNYNTLTQQLSSQYSRLRNVINEGRR
ncbi:MAG: flagellar basal body rod protein FlgB [Syntrophomonadaceae bacterium]|nr:flagellar basal body rod protein FlgB [Syntrophomonadaceae bacterium]